MDTMLSELEATAQKHIVAETLKPSEDLKGKYVRACVRIVLTIFE